MSPDTMFMTIKVNTSITITVLLSLTEENAHCSHQNMQNSNSNNNNKIIGHYRLQTVLKKRLKTVWVDPNNISKENRCEKIKNSF